MIRALIRSKKKAVGDPIPAEKGKTSDHNRKLPFTYNFIGLLKSKTFWEKCKEKMENKHFED